MNNEITAYSRWILHKQADAFDGATPPGITVFASGQAADGIIVLPHPDPDTVDRMYFGSDVEIALGRLGYPCDALHLGLGMACEIVTDTFARPPGILRDRVTTIPHVLSWVMDVTTDECIAGLMNCETGQTVDVTSVAFQGWTPVFLAAGGDALRQPLGDREHQGRRQARKDLRRMTDEGRLVASFRKPGTFKAQLGLNIGGGHESA